MRFTLLLKDEAKPEELARYTDALERSGVLLASGGTWLIQARTRAEAEAWAARAPVPVELEETGS